jgi:hypothetical protein
MNTKFISRSSIRIIVLLFLFTACKKRTELTYTNTTDDTAEQTIIAGDQFEVNYEFDQVINEALRASCISSTTSGTAGSTIADILFTQIPDAVIDTGKINKGIITITYYGKTPDKTKARSGVIEIRHSLASGKVVPWKTPGATVKIIFKQFEVIFENVINKSIVLNDTCTVTNLHGGLLTTLSPIDSVVDKLNAKLSFTNNDNLTVLTQWTWYFSKHRVFRLNDTTISATITGDTTVNNVNNVATWGTTRSDQPFCASIATPLVQHVSGSSFLYVPLRGVENIQMINEPITITYGVDPSGYPVSTGKPYGYKFKWINANGIASGIVTNY